MAERFYVSFPLTPGPVVLEGAEAHHLAVVCRARPGDTVYLFNGDGRQYPAEVVAIGRRQIQLSALRVEAPVRELGFRLEAAVALPKGDRAAFLVEKLTELGVTSFIPLETTRSVVHPREAKWEKLQRQVIEASKQCGRNVLMEVHRPVSWEALLRRPDLPATRLLAHPEGSTPASRAIAPSPADVLFAVGPEGGFTDEEVTLALASGWRSVALGPRILRIETAALALAALTTNACGAG